ncbi:hypothetical protein ISS22_15855 [candidate division KSB1 bacterium]|nr:hypothetical protein [candidate division KSB1 bacterium]
MNVILEVTVLLTLVLALSFLIERLMEILKAIYDLLDSRLDWYKFWTIRTYKVRDKLAHKLKIVEYVSEKNLASILNKFGEKLLNNTNEYSGTVPVLSGDLVRTVSVKSTSKIISLILGIGIAFWMNVDLLKIWQEASGDTSLWLNQITTPGLRIGISGVIIGLGSNPLHKFVTTIEKKSKKKREKQKNERG